MDSDKPPTDLPSQPTQRDLRLDLIRGVALLCMHTDHFRHNELASWTPRNFGFSDMAEVFVFVSGCVCGIAYGKVLQTRGFLICQRKAIGRACQLVVASAITLLALAIIQSYLAQHDRASADGWSLWLQRGTWLTPDWQSLRAIEGGSQVAGILSLYVMLLVVLPTMLWLRARHWSLLVGPSLMLYGAAQVDWRNASPLGNWSQITAFHPCAWQLLFALGILLYESFRSGRMLAAGHWFWPIAALVIVEGAFVAKFWLPSEEIPLIDKTTLGSLRILHLLALIVLAYIALPDQSQGLWKTWPIRWLVLCGQNSLIVFCSGSVLVVLFEGLLLAKSHSLTRQVVANLVVWGGCVVLAAIWQAVPQR